MRRNQRGSRFQLAILLANSNKQIFYYYFFEMFRLAELSALIFRYIGKFILPGAKKIVPPVFPNRTHRQTPTLPLCPLCPPRPQTLLGRTTTRPTSDTSRTSTSMSDMDTTGGNSNITEEEIRVSLLAIRRGYVMLPTVVQL